MKMNDLPKSCKPFRSRMLVVVDVNGEPLGSIDLTGIPNANPQAQVSVFVKEQCDLGHWHSSSILLPCWGAD